MLKAENIHKYYGALWVLKGVELEITKGEIVSIVGPSGRLTGHLTKEIRFCCTEPDLLSSWKERYEWSATQANMVDNSGTIFWSNKLSSATIRRIAL